MTQRQRLGLRRRCSHNLCPPEFISATTQDIGMRLFGYNENVYFSDSESSDEEDIEINKKSTNFFEILTKFKVHAPSFYQPDNIFESESDSDNDMKDENKDMTRRKKPRCLKDVVVAHLIEEGPEFEDVEPRWMKKTNFEEQVFLEWVKNLVEKDDGGALLKERENKDKNEGDGDGDGDGDDGEFQKKLGEYFGPDAALDENSKFLKDFFEKQMWIDRENKSSLVEDDEFDVLLRDVEEVEKQEKYEVSYNFRYENIGDRVIAYSMIIEGSVRKKKNSRKKQRKNNGDETKSASDQERKPELDETNMEVPKALKLSRNRMAAYQNIQLKKRKHRVVAG